MMKSSTRYGCSFTCGSPLPTDLSFPWAVATFPSALDAVTACVCFGIVASASVTVSSPPFDPCFFELRVLVDREQRPVAEVPARRDRLEAEDPDLAEKRLHRPS